ncbi:thiamine pyrophosphate-dependent enzyme [Saccharopolyspora oryzae]|uniref:Thiamine pyrophosphate-dependent enzyme n=1 Tax=Saccharopolyspora oryzae TaxID=2997343 RepID=A0ABT4UWS8_9PSEU|nr:thiamine pyrophosphate-dependent enzyme [Saccharopolyspora oryzae]MDA3625547.1 thiamine pyrophosphate-dependent enzyme [Saccharopolyspora oryzae]
MDIVSTDRPPETASRKVAEFRPPLQLGEHSLCPGCGEPVVLRVLLETLQELGLVDRTIGVVGHGCYGSFVRIMDVDVLQCLHGRAPACATGIKRMRPDTAVFTLQGDGDMVNEGLQEVIHAAARAENVTCILLNNGVFGDTGGQQTTTTVLGQRTKTSLDGREADQHGYPIPIADIVAQLDGVGYVARGAVGTAGGVARTKRMIRNAFESQLAGEGFGLVEVLTMCPTGWFVTAPQGPDYLAESMEQTYPLGELRPRRSS